MAWTCSCRELELRVFFLNIEETDLAMETFWPFFRDNSLRPRSLVQSREKQDARNRNTNRRSSFWQFFEEFHLAVRAWLSVISCIRWRSLRISLLLRYFIARASDMKVTVKGMGITVLLSQGDRLSPVLWMCGLHSTAGRLVCLEFEWLSVVSRLCSVPVLVCQGCHRPKRIIVPCLFAKVSPMD